MEARLRVLRSTGHASDEYQRFVVSVEPGATVLDALEAIRRRKAPELSYRHSCHHGSCGTCACRINGRERLACTTRIEELDTREITVEPLQVGRVLADLVVDRSAFFEAMPPGTGYLRDSETNPGAPHPDEVAGFVRFENCIECGACVSACPVEVPFIGPAALAALNRKREKRPEAQAEVLDRAGAEDGAMTCERALECSRVCPTGVYPARHIMDLRRLLGGQS